jgi:hypothetical protein
MHQYPRAVAAERISSFKRRACRTFDIGGPPRGHGGQRLVPSERSTAMRQEADGRPEARHDTMTTKRAIIDASLPVPSRSDAWHVRHEKATFGAPQRSWIRTALSPPRYAAERAPIDASATMRSSTTRAVGAVPGRRAAAGSSRTRPARSLRSSVTAADGSPLSRAMTSRSRCPRCRPVVVTTRVPGSGRARPTGSRSARNASGSLVDQRRRADGRPIGSRFAGMSVQQRRGGSVGCRSAS